MLMGYAIDDGETGPRTGTDARCIRPPEPIEGVLEGRRVETVPMVAHADYRHVILESGIRARIGGQYRQVE